MVGETLTMLDMDARLLFFFTIISISSFIASYLILKMIIGSNKNFLSLLYVKAEKSPTHASLLGGLPLSLLSFISVAISLVFFSSKFSPNEIFILKTSLTPIFIVTFYGYMDDRYEIRARHKLLLQIISITSFVVPICLNLYQSHLVVTIGLVTFGLAYINGSNLIDGLDTIFAKLGTAMALVFLLLSIELSSLPSIILSLVTISSTLAFYLYNKEPAKIYAGEIGGSLLGILMFIQANFLVEKYNFSSQLSDPQEIIAKIIIASIYPLSELGITFFRRIYFKQSPFRGDHLHLHHIVKTKFKMTASKTANAIALIYIATVFVGFALIQKTSPFLALTLTVLIMCSIYSFICYPYWKKTYSQNNSSEIFLNINQNHVYVIDGKEIESLYFQYYIRDKEEKKKLSA